MYSNIEEFNIPTSLNELKEGWCCGLKKLTKILISPLNNNFIFKDNKYLHGKSDPNNDEFDVLLFVIREIERFIIPSNIKIIASFAFEKSKIKEISIPSNVNKICKNAFGFCQNLQMLEIPTNSNLQTIEDNAFSNLKIEQFYIPSKVSKIGDKAFQFCGNLLIIEISTESNLPCFPLSSFYFCSQILIMVSPSLEKLVIHH